MALAALTLFLFASCPARADQPKTPPAASTQRKQIDDLLKKLAAPDLNDQTQAATALIKLGPDILPLLDSQRPNLTDHQKERLNSVAAALRESQALRDLAPKLCDFPEEPIGFQAALDRLKDQTGVQVDDRREKTDAIPPLRLKLHQATFWQALDAIAREADLRVLLFHPESRVALANGPFIALPVSYHGIFRVSVERIMNVEDLAAGKHVCMLGLEVAWEPRFHPLFMQRNPDALEVRDNQGSALDPIEPGTGRLPIGGPCAMQWQIALHAPRRSAAKLATIEGKLAVIGPGRMLTFAFDQLDMKEPDKRADQTLEGVTAKLRDFPVDTDIWSAHLTLDYPAETPDFESFESWLVNNEIYLESKSGKARAPANGGYEIDEQTGHHAAMTYRFIEDQNVTLGKRSDWKLVYKTPGALVKLPIPFEFKDVPLP